MKNLFKISFIALAMFATACAEIEEPDKPQDPGTTETPETPDTPEEPGDTPDDGTIVFTANVPVKTAIDADDVKVTWVDGDQVKFIWAGGEYVAVAKGSGATTKFEVPVEDGITELYAVYPSTMDAELVDGKLVLDFVNTLENGTFAANDVTVSRALKAEEWNTTLNFKNAACLFKVGVDKAETKRVQISACNGEIIGGALTVVYGEDGNLTFEYPAEGKTTMNMAISAPGNYYIPLFPGVTMESGFRINLFEGEGEDETQGTPFYYMAEFTTERGAIYRYPNFETNAGHYYVATQKQGTGAAHKASDAMDVDSFKELVTNKENHTLLRGATFHFAAEEFSFGDDYLVFDYSDHSIVNLTLEGSGSGDNMTVFKGRSNTSDSNKAGVLWPQSNTDLTVKNVKFTGVKGKSNAAVVRINSGAKKVTFEDCVFDGNETVNDKGTGVGTGACLALYNGAELTVKGCTFTGNAGCGAAVVVNHEAAKVRIENSVIKECSQKSNAIYIQKCAQFELVDTEISDNYSYATVYAVTAFAGSFRAERTVWKNNHAYDDYGAAGWYESTATFEFKDCQFIDNMADCGGGALMFVKAHAVIDGCTFQGNHADGADNTAAAGGAIYAKGEGVTVDCKNTLFKKNYNFVGTNLSSGGIIRVQQDGGIARFDNCVFDGNYTNRSKADGTYPSAAIINCRQDGAKYYFNACEFMHNASGTGDSGNEQGGLRGMVIASCASSTIAMNNCSMHDNYGSASNSEPTYQWIYLDDEKNTFILSNSTIVGDPTRKVGETVTVCSDHWGIIKLHSTGNYHFINDIICSNYTDGNCFWINGDVATSSDKLPVTSYYNKTSPEGDNRTNWVDDTGSGHNYFATTGYFSSWESPHLWDGTLLKGTNNTSFAPTDGVNTKIQEADSDFHGWLTSIGALGKDINGKDRGTTSWPGCYQN